MHFGVVFFFTPCYFKRRLKGRFKTNTLNPFRSFSHLKTKQTKNYSRIVELLKLFLYKQLMFQGHSGSFFVTSSLDYFWSFYICIYIYIDFPLQQGRFLNWLPGCGSLGSFGDCCFRIIMDVKKMWRRSNPFINHTIVKVKSHKSTHTSRIVLVKQKYLLCNKLICSDFFFLNITEGSFVLVYWQNKNLNTSVMEA